MRNSLIAEGCVIAKGAKIENSVIGLRCRIGEGATVCDSILMGADYYDSEEVMAGDLAAGRPALGIGAGAFIAKTIVDKNCHVGKNVRIDAKSKTMADEDREQVVMRDGIAVVRRGATLPDGWKL